MLPSDSKAPALDRELAGALACVIMHERWLAVGEIAAHLGVYPDTIYKWIVRKKMPAHKLGRLWKFLASEVDQWIKGGHAAEDITTDTAPADPTTELSPKATASPGRTGHRQ